MLRNDRITSSYFSHCCCSSPHAAEIWAPLVSTTLCADAADEQRYETFDQCWVSQDRIAQRGVGQPCDHRNLDGGQDLPRTDTEGREPRMRSLSASRGPSRTRGSPKACVHAGWFPWGP